MKYAIDHSDELDALKTFYQTTLLSDEGYIRSYWGKALTKGPIGYRDGKRGSWTGYHYPKWVECGIKIPGEDIGDTDGTCSVFHSAEVSEQISFMLLLCKCICINAHQ